MKVKNCFLLIIFLTLAASMQGQVLMNLQLPPLGLTLKPQLWNLSLVNNGNTTITARIELVVTDVSTNQRVLSATTNSFLLYKGAKQVRPADVMPITYSIGSPGYSVDPSPDGFLPIGTFNVCYSLINMDSDAWEKLAEECETVDVEPVSPPQLIMPADNEPVVVTRPMFIWMPPAPFNSYTSLLYDWTLVEVMPTQSAADAIQQNIPVLSRPNIAFTNFQYPLSMTELDTAKTYAWRVVAKNFSSPIANSEIWTFKITKDTGVAIAAGPSGYFARLHAQEDASYVLCDGLLRFEYTNELNTGEVSLKVSDISTANHKPVPLPGDKLPVQYGANYLQLDLRNSSGMINKHMYLMELRNSKNEVCYLRFEYRKP